MRSLGHLRTLTPQGPGVTTLRIDVALAFRPGQAVQVQIPGDTKKRFFSVSSAPSEGRFIEITVKAEAQSPLAQALSALVRGTEIEIEGPFGGALSIPEPLPETLCFIAAGTGVTPFRSMIRSLLDSNSTSALWLLHSVKTQPELLFHDEFNEWAGAFKTFHYVPTLTQDFDDNWKNETGRINEVLLRKHVPEHPVTYLLCGTPDFVRDIETMLLTQLKADPARIIKEKW